MHYNYHHLTAPVPRCILCQVVVPRGPIKAKGLLLASIRDPDPVIFLEPKVLYRSAVEQVPEEDYMLPLGKADVLTEGERGGGRVDTDVITKDNGI